MLIDFKALIKIFKAEFCDSFLSMFETSVAYKIKIRDVE